MKRLKFIVICLVFFLEIHAQQYKSVTNNFSPHPAKHIDASQVHQLKQSLMSGVQNHARGGSQNVLLDYDALDEIACSDSGGTYDRYIWDLHSQFPDDSAYTYSYNWTAVSFDTLVDAITGTSFPYATSQVTIDSIVVFVAHENYTGTQDQIVISVLQYIPGALSTVLMNGLQTDPIQSAIVNNVLFADTIRTTTSLTPGLTNLATLTVKPGLTLAMGEKFLVSVHFYGDTLNDFYFLSGFCDICGQTCVAEGSSFENNSISREIYWQQGTSYSGRDNDLYYPCGRSGAPFSAIPGNCEEWYVQNTAIQAYLTINSGSGVVCTPPAATGTPGWSPPYDSLNCVDKGVPYDEVVNFENFTTISGPSGNLTVNSFRIDSITNLPCGLSWQTNKVDNTFNSGETGCINITGITTDTVGQYEWGMYVTVNVQGVGPVSGELKALVSQLALIGITVPDLSYYLRVKVPASSCPSVNTGIAGNTACTSGVTPTGNCIIMSNVDSSDTPLNWGNVTGGYVAGHNGQGFPAFAEFFPNSTSGIVPNVTFWFLDAQYGNPASKITATIWEASSTSGVFGNPNQPGNILATEDILISDIATDVTLGDFTSVTFSTPASVTGDFYAGFQVTYAAGDTVGLVLNDNGESAPPGLLWISVDNVAPGQWARVDSLFGITVSGFIFPQLCSPCPPITVGVTKTNATCSGPTGTASATAVGGIAPYSYAWSNGQTGNSASGLIPGIYQVTATDSNGCQGISSFTIGSNVVNLAVSGSSTANNSCVSHNGSASVSVSNGTPNYSYAWSGNTGGQITATATALDAGSYSITVYDANGCIGSTIVNVADSTPTLQATINTTATHSCITPDGTASVSATGGSGNYTYSWSNAQTTQMLSGLSAGPVAVTVTEIPSSCTVTVSDTVSSSTVNINVTVTTTPEMSCVSPDGSVTAVVTGGSGNYSYSWNNSATTQTQAGLSAGNYSVTVTDNPSSCTGNASGSVADSTATLSVSLTHTNATSGSANDGTATATASGGSGSYTYSWSNFTTGAHLTGLAPGIYGLTLTDNVTGCSVMDSVIVSFAVGTAPQPAEDYQLFLFPNPTTGMISLNLHFSQKETVKIEWFNILGEQIIYENQDGITAFSRIYDLSGYAEGVYILKVTFGDRTVLKRVSLSR